MEKRIVLIVLWILCTLGMVLHFNYHIGELFYGIDIVRPDANGKVPTGVFIIRTLYYHLPMVWIVLIMYGKKPWIHSGLLLVGVGYSLSHLAHLTGELLNPERSPSQISLLILVFVLSVVLAYEHYLYWKLRKEKPIEG
ncbi:MAG: hypothetical protein AAGA43_01960 [Bacteroidota bacterium]